MDHEEYVVARHGRLVELAVELGCSEEEARDEVTRVLEEQRRQIARSDDPDPGVRAALTRRIAGDPEPRRSPWVIASLAAVALVVVAGVTLGRPDAPPRLPSLFGYDVVAATQVLTDAGYVVETERAEACEPRDLVLASDPAPGATARRGSTITLRTAIPSDPGCLATFGFRTDAWDFVAFVRGGAPPQRPGFAPMVTVHLDGATVALLSARAAADRRSWPVALAPVEQVASQVAPTGSAMPRLVVDSAVPPSRSCGVPVPAGREGQRALRLVIDPSPDGTQALCPVAVDLYRDAGRRITAVAVYSGAVRGDAP